MHKGLATLGAFILALNTGSAHAASYDCNKARSADEVAICKSPALGELDVKMATLYNVSSHLYAMGARGAMQDDQQIFLKQRKSCSGNTACLRNAYQARISQLEKGLERIYENGPY